MKNFLFIFTLLLGMLLFIPKEEWKASDSQRVAQKEAVMKDKGMADIQYHLEILSNDLKGSNCLTPRRVVQSGNNTIDIRIQKSAEKFLQLLRLKEENMLRKISEGVSLCQTINLSTLLCRKGYHVYALRKIII